MPDFADGDQQTELDKTLPLDPLSRLNCLVFGVHSEYINRLVHATMSVCTNYSSCHQS